MKSSLVYPNGLTASWTYDANNQLLQVCNAFPTNVISQYDYTYDLAGRRINVSKTGIAFTQDDTVSYGYNVRSELTNAVAAVDSNYRYTYDFDEIGNRETSSERGANSVYTANNLNQYTAVDDFTPQFDDDGNQTLVKTTTGIWQVKYNGENRPIFWVQGTNTISMSYDRMGRRVTKNDQRFIYDGYLCIGKIEDSTSIHYSLSPIHCFVWDPTEPIATRPLVWSFSTVQPFNFSTFYYAHDANKNVSEIIASDSAFSLHYEYTPFGAVTIQRGASAVSNFWRFSSEYAEDDTETVYYNFRHYEPCCGRWLSTDPIGNRHGDLSLYCFLYNNPLWNIDRLGLLKTGVKSCVSHYYSCIWHAYIQVGDWTIGWAGSPYEENLNDNSARRCVEMERKNEGVMPDGKPCKCATAQELQKCVQDESNWPIGDYLPFLGRSCGTWVKEVANRCCMIAEFRAPWFDPNAKGCANIGGPIIFGPSWGWEWPNRK
jgi:RHS repeat-associated protein